MRGTVNIQAGYTLLIIVAVYVHLFFLIPFTFFASAESVMQTNNYALNFKPCNKSPIVFRMTVQISVFCEAFTNFQFLVKKKKQKTIFDIS